MAAEILKGNWQETWTLSFFFFPTLPSIFPLSLWPAVNTNWCLFPLYLSDHNLGLKSGITFSGNHETYYFKRNGRKALLHFFVTEVKSNCDNHMISVGRVICISFGCSSKRRYTYFWSTPGVTLGSTFGNQSWCSGGQLACPLSSILSL